MTTLKKVERLYDMFSNTQHKTLGEFMRIDKSFKDRANKMKVQLYLKDSDLTAYLALIATYWKTYFGWGLKDLIISWKLGAAQNPEDLSKIGIKDVDVINTFHYKILKHLYEDYFGRGSFHTKDDLQNIPETMANNKIPTTQKFFSYIHDELVGPIPAKLEPARLNLLNLFFVGTSTDFGPDYKIPTNTLDRLINFELKDKPIFDSLDDGEKNYIRVAAENLLALKEALHLPGDLQRSHLYDLVQTVYIWREKWTQNNHFHKDIKKMLEDELRGNQYVEKEANKYILTRIYDEIYDEQNKSTNFSRGIETSRFLKEVMKPDDAFFEYIKRMVQPERRHIQQNLMLPAVSSIPTVTPTTPVVQPTQDSESSVGVIAGIAALLALIILSKKS